MWSCVEIDDKLKDGRFSIRFMSIENISCSFSCRRRKNSLNYFEVYIESLEALNFCVQKDPTNARKENKNSSTNHIVNETPFISE